MDSENSVAEKVSGLESAAFTSVSSIWYFTVHRNIHYPEVRVGGRIIFHDELVVIARSELFHLESVGHMVIHAVEIMSECLGSPQRLRIIIIRPATVHKHAYLVAVHHLGKGYQLIVSVCRFLHPR